LWFSGALLLGIAIAYGVIKTSRLSGEEKQRLNEATKLRQRADDPMKR
jgi:hypothetical protein